MRGPPVLRADVDSRPPQPDAAASDMASMTKTMGEGRCMIGSILSRCGRWLPLQRGAAEIEALADFLHGVRALGDVVLELDRGRDLPLVLLHELEDLLDRRFAGAPREVQRAVLGGRPILQVEARGPVVVLLQELQ